MHGLRRFLSSNLMLCQGGLFLLLTFCHACCTTVQKPLESLAEQQGRLFGTGIIRTQNQWNLNDYEEQYNTKWPDCFKNNLKILCIQQWELVHADKESILLLSGWPSRDEFGVLASVRIRQVFLLKQLSSQLCCVLFFDVSVGVSNWLSIKYLCFQLDEKGSSPPNQEFSGLREVIILLLNTCALFSQLEGWYYSLLQFQFFFFFGLYLSPSTVNLLSRNKKLPPSV